MDDNYVSEIVRAIRDGIEKDKAPSVYAKKSISLSAAKKLSDIVEAEAYRIGVKPVIGISNAGANPVLIHAADDSYIASFEVALSKAYTSVSLKMPTSELKTMANPGGSLYGIQFTSPGKIAVFGGGDPLIKDGETVGGIGVSGGSEEEDTYLSAYGARIFKEEF